MRNEVRKKVEQATIRTKTGGQGVVVPDGLILTASHCINWSHRGEMVLSYLGQNDYFGEIGLLRNAKRGATCTALDHVEHVKIENKYFKFILECFEEFKQRLEKEARGPVGFASG